MTWCTWYMLILPHRFSCQTTERWLAIDLTYWLVLPMSARIQTHLLRQAIRLFKKHCNVNKAGDHTVYEKKKYWSAFGLCRSNYEFEWWCLLCMSKWAELSYLSSGERSVASFGQQLPFIVPYIRTEVGPKQNHHSQTQSSERSVTMSSSQWNKIFDFESSFWSFQPIWLGENLLSLG